jgi:hypothetical protein
MVIFIPMLIQIKDTGKNEVHINLVAYASEIKLYLLHQNYGLLPYVHNLLVGRMVVF